MKILIVDDNAAVRTTLKMILAAYYDEVTAIGDPKILPAVLAGGNVDAVVLDMNFDNNKFDGKEGLFWLSRIKESESTPAVVLITAFGDVPLAVEAMKRGADDFVTKPWDNDDLIAKINKSIAKNKTDREQIRTLKMADNLKRRLDEKQQLSLDELKRVHVEETVNACGGNLSAAAIRLGVNRQTLYNMLKKK